jgi:glutaconate CoA-transferase subunit A
MLGSDTVKFSGAKVAECPYTGKPYVLYPALYPDVAVIHVHEADVYGNARIRGTTIADQTLARAAKRIILTAERIIPNDEIRSRPASTNIPYYAVDAVCEAPYGSYPANMPYLYYSDEDHLKTWLDVERDPVEHKKFIDKHIFGTANFNEYLQLCGGLARLIELERIERMIARPDTYGDDLGVRR